MLFFVNVAHDGANKNLSKYSQPSHVLTVRRHLESYTHRTSLTHTVYIKKCSVPVFLKSNFRGQIYS